LPLPSGFVFLLANPPGCAAPRITTGVVAVLRWDDACVGDGASVTVVLAAAASRDDPRVWTRMGLTLRPGEAPAPEAVGPLPTWPDGGVMSAERHQHTGTLRPDGRVLVVGGYTAAGNNTGAAALFEPTTGVWTPTTPTQSGHGGVTAAI